MVDVFKGMPKLMNKGAYRGTLKCPYWGCDGTSFRRIEDVNPWRLRYRCRKCGKTFQYDISNRPSNPYAAFNTPHFRRIVEKSKTLKGSKK